MTLQDFVQKVLEQNESLQQRLLEVEISDRKLKSEKGAFEPDLVLSADRVYNKRENTAEQIRSLGVPVFEEKNNIYNAGLESLVPTGARLRLGYSLKDLNNNLQRQSTLFGTFTNEFQSFFGLSLQQPLLKGFGKSATMAGIRLAAVSSEIAFQEYRRQLMVVISTAEATYWGLFLAQEQVRFFNDSVAVAESILRDNRARVQAGKASELEVLEAESALALRRSKQSEAVERLHESMNRLTTLYGEPPRGASVLQAVDRPAVGEAEFPYADTARLAFDLNPDYLIQRKKLFLENIRLAYAKNQRWPQLDLKASYGLNGLGETPASSHDDLERADFPSWSVGLELRVPITGGIKARNEVAAGKLRQKQALISLKEIETQIVNSLDTALQKIRSGKESVRSYQTVVTFNQNLLESQLARLQVGKVESRKVLEVEADLFEAKSSLAEALVQYQRALLELDLVRGSILQSHHLDLTQKELKAKTDAYFKKASVSDSQYERLLKEHEAAYAARALPVAEIAKPSPSVAPVQPAPRPTPVRVTPASAKPKPVPAVVPASPPLGAPVAPVPLIRGVGTRDQRLLELLDAYKGNQITPAEYHERRAKIVGEP